MQTRRGKKGQNLTPPLTPRGIRIEYDAEVVQRAAPPEAMIQYLLAKDYPASWKASSLATYNGLQDPEDYVHTFTMGMEDMAQCWDIWFRMFRRTLSGNTMGWYHMLLLGSILSYDDLQEAFLVTFSHWR